MSAPQPSLFNLFLEKIMQETLQDHYTSTGGRPISNVKFGDKINLMGGTRIEQNTPSTDSKKDQEYTGRKSTRRSQRLWHIACLTPEKTAR
ncbi:hypothetical protein DPMN_029740 [Dreissena polymorpha]|uniref:Uncharacterized protein n=1 Tax=Dreissena polymorpha TaxID=45954 RepID=A0A9D4RHE8_DREPO|nr:hypothetical protein DPMN_029740 [Dreissena polymorpha]